MKIESNASVLVRLTVRQLDNPGYAKIGEISQGLTKPLTDVIEAKVRPRRMAKQVQAHLRNQRWSNTRSAEKVSSQFTGAW